MFLGKILGKYATKDQTLKYWRDMQKTSIIKDNSE
jgi:hypothetical protein